ncbi:MAG: TolC family protein [Bacteroidota bacterium]
MFQYKSLLFQGWSWLFWTVAGAGFLPLTAMAQSVLSLQEATEIALAENQQLKLLGYDRQISQNQIDPAFAGIGPQIILQGSIYYGWADSKAETIPLGPATEPQAPFELSGVRHGVVLQPEANWLVYDGGAGQLRLDQLRLADEATALAIENVREQVVAQVTQAYLGAASLEQQLYLAEENIDLSAERLARAERDTRYGTGNSLRRLQAQVDLNTDSVAYQQLELALENAKRDINFLLGRPPNTIFLLSVPQGLGPSYQYEQLATDLLTSNENLAQAKQRIALSEKAAELTEISFRPNVQLYANLQYVNTTDNANFLLANRTLGTEAGVRASYTLYDGGLRKINRQNAKINLERSRLDREAIELELLTRLQQAYANYQNNLRQLAFERNNLATFELNYEKSQTDYRLGQVEATVLRTAQVNLNAAKIRITLREFSVREAEVELLRLAGRLVD